VVGGAGVGVLVVVVGGAGVVVVDGAGVVATTACKEPTLTATTPFWTEAILGNPLTFDTIPNCKVPLVTSMSIAVCKLAMLLDVALGG